ncbi:MAG: tetratricopeptide repeat protein, partial [Bacteroidetes bacterium]|nr:tetratricopeptide repeat protein [Bacteroidota bacterium]
MNIIEEITSLAQNGIQLTKEGNFNNAEAQFLRALELSRHYNLIYHSLGLLIELGQLYRDTGRFHEAEQHLLNGISILESNPHLYNGNSRSRIPTFLKELAKVYVSAGRYHVAFDVIVKAIELEEETLGENDAQKAEAFQILATAMFHSDQFQDAVEIIKNRFIPFFDQNYPDI